MGLKAYAKSAPDDAPPTGNAPAKPPSATGSIKHDGDAVPAGSVVALRERSISALVDLVGDGNYAVQSRKFEGFIKNHTILAPGWKAIVLDDGGTHEGLNCALLHDPQRRSAKVRVCSARTATPLRPKDCVRITGLVVAYPADQTIVVRGEVTAEKAGCYHAVRRPTPTKSTETWFDRLFNPQPITDAKP